MPAMTARRVAGPLAALLIVLAALAGCGRETSEAPVPPEPEVAEAPANEATAEGAAAPRAAEESAEEPTAEDAVAREPEPPAAPDAAAAAPRPSLGARLLRGLGAVASFLGRLLFVLVIPIAIAATLLGLPGSVLVVVDALVYSAAHGWASPRWWVLILLVAIAIVSELAENALSFAGVKQSGASTKTGFWVLVGGFAGAVFGGAIAPLLATIGGLAGPAGWVILSLLPPIGLGMVGGYLGGYWFELRQGRTREEARQAGWGALLGRVAGSFTKALLVAVMGAVLLMASWGTLV